FRFGAFGRRFFGRFRFRGRFFGRRFGRSFFRFRARSFFRFRGRPTFGAAALLRRPAALAGRDLLDRRRGGELTDLGLEEFRHPLLLFADVAGEFRRLGVADFGREDLQRQVGRDLLVLGGELRLGVLQQLLLLAVATDRVQRAFRDRGRFAD